MRRRSAPPKTVRRRERRKTRRIATQARTGGRIRVGVIYGGRSVEHEVSLVSAQAVMQALDPDRYDVVPIGITKAGRWSIGDTHYALPGDPSVGGLIEVAKARASRSVSRSRKATSLHSETRLDVVFPVVHGTGGEDGSLQGLLTLAGIPFVGAGVLGSAVGMDKVVMKSLFRQAGLPILEYKVVMAQQLKDNLRHTLISLEEAIGYPCFVKPANGGSSVGISKAKDRAMLEEGLRMAARYDRKMVVEHGIDAREIECSVLGNDDPEASVPGEIIPINEFYDYRAKYVDSGTRLEVPASLSREQERQVRDLAIRAFKVLDLAGMARVDLFLDRHTGEIFLNELNTLPGFTPISMYPKLWEASGVSFPELVDRLIQLAIERHADRKSLITSYDASNNGGALNA